MLKEIHKPVLVASDGTEFDLDHREDAINHEVRIRAGLRIEQFMQQIDEKEEYRGKNRSLVRNALYKYERAIATGDLSEIEHVTIGGQDVDRSAA